MKDKSVEYEMFRSAELKVLYAQLENNHKRTRADFIEEVWASERMIEYMRTIMDGWTMTASLLDTTPHLQAIVNLFARNRQLFMSAYSLFAIGCYGSSLCLQRMMLENANLMRLFKVSPVEAASWKEKRFEDSDIVKAAYAPKPKLRSEYRGFYGTLNDYIHPNEQGWKELFVPLKEGSGLPNAPIYRKEIAERLWGLLLLLGTKTIREFVTTFAKNMNKEKLLDGRDLMPELSKVLSKYVKRET